MRPWRAKERNSASGSEGATPPVEDEVPVGTGAAVRLGAEVGAVALDAGAEPELEQLNTTISGPRTSSRSSRGT